MADWRELTDTKNVVVVPFFISDGLHSYEDIPALLGIKADASQGEVFQRNPYQINDRLLFYASAIGTDPRFAQIIIDQAISFDRANQLQSAP